MIDYNKTQEPLVISKATIDRILRLKKPANCMALYTFYYYTAKWQETTSVKASVSYCAKGLGIGETAIRKAKEELKSIGLIDDVKRIDDSTGRVTGWYVSVRFVWQKPPSQLCNCGCENHPSKNPQCGEMDTNALNTGILNALNTGTVATAPAESESEDELCSSQAKEQVQSKDNACAPSKKKKTLEFRAPTAEEVRKYATDWAVRKHKDVRAVVQVAEQARSYYDRLDWRDSRNKPIKAWKQKIVAVWLTDDKINEARGVKPKATHRLTGEAGDYV